ncbi:MAG: hypothetical protein KTR20_14880 [Cellvibrionaceae bacterium]|nr:hypothetical protein [Cellvibrionaceae bacterium]
MKKYFSALLVSLVLTVNACGQTGPLVLPGSSGADQARANTNLRLT